MPENHINSIANNSVPKYSPKYSKAINGDNANTVINTDHGACPSEIKNAFFNVFLTVFSKVHCNVSE